MHYYRYQRVDIVREDSDTDTEDDLDRVLGPSSRTQSNQKQPKMKKWQKCFTVFTVLITLSGLLAVVILGTVVYPEKVQEVLGIINRTDTENITQTPIENVTIIDGTKYFLIDSKLSSN